MMYFFNFALAQNSKFLHNKKIKINCNTPTKHSCIFIGVFEFACLILHSRIRVFHHLKISPTEKLTYILIFIHFFGLNKFNPSLWHSCGRIKAPQLNIVDRRIQLREQVHYIYSFGVS